MTTRSLLLRSFLVSLAVWLLFTWPLPRYLFDGIPISHHGGSSMPPHTMYAGDHLQLEYYFWLFSDMVQGNTPWFYNLYEFNTGDDEARYMPTEYYFPFSAFYTVGALLGGRAFGYNFSAFMSIWITYFFSWLLVRRYVQSDLWAGLAAVFAILFPYRWFALLGGSPTGLAMAWAPLLLWGLDRAVRDGSVRGGCWAALAVVLSYTGDLHVFFFNILLIPAWCVVAFVAGMPFEWRKTAAYRRIALGLLPVCISTLAVVAYSQRIATGLGETHMAEGRDVGEVMIFSPQRAGVFAWAEVPVSSQAYMGYFFVAWIALGAIGVGYRAYTGRDRAWRALWLTLLLLGGSVLIVLLALGPHGPPGARFFTLARNGIPHYDMIRQAGKILSVFPPIGAVLLGITGAALWPRHKSHALYRACMGLPLALLLYDYGRRNDPPICLFEQEQPAYRAVAEDAAARGINPHVFVVTLWPGDAHFASVYQYYTSLYRIRMVNGYTPAIDSIYFNDIFMRFQSMNQGWMTEDQADELLERSIEYLVIHEDLFPEKVSPFPIAHTITALYAHPRLSFLKQSGPVWAFRILPESRKEPNDLPKTTEFYAARHWIFENQPHESGEVRQDESASRGQYLALLAPGAASMAGVTDAPPVPEQRWLIRVRGQGTFTAQAMANAEVVHTETVTVDQATWQWIAVPSPLREYADVSVHLTLNEGQLDFCSALLTGGRSIVPEPDERVVLPAAWFFHAGHLDLDTLQVHFRRRHDSAGFVFYGPKLPLPAGEYEVELHFTSDAPDRTHLGALHFEQLFTHTVFAPVPVIAGARATSALPLLDNLPLNIMFQFAAHSDISLESVSLRRLTP